MGVWSKYTTVWYLLHKFFRPKPCVDRQLYLKQQFDVYYLWSNERNRNPANPGLINEIVFHITELCRQYIWEFQSEIEQVNINKINNINHD